MVTISGIYESLARYEKDNYYLKDEQGKALAPEKIGGGWEKLGFKGEISEDVYRALKEGKDPSTGERIIQAGVNGEHRGGYNLTFSPDKSWTVYAHSSPEAGKLVSDIHNKAMSDVMQYFQSDLAQVRQGQHGAVEPVKTGNILAIRVDHTVNREGDVGNHSHLVVFNQSYNEHTGKWQALHSDPFHSDILTKLYENQLAYYGKEAVLPIEWKVSDSGRTMYASISGVPDKAIETTSERARQVDAYVKEHYTELKERYPNSSDGELKQIAALETRKDKVSMTPEQIDKQFVEKLESVGITKQDIIRGVSEKAVEHQEQRLDTVKMNEYEALQQAEKSITDYSSTFSRQDLLKASVDISRGDASISKIEDAVKDMDGQIIKLRDSHTIEQRGRTYNDQLYTSREVLQAEKQALKEVERGKGAVGAIMTKEEAQNALRAYAEKFHAEKGYEMTPSQIKAVDFMLTNADRYNAVQGYAGTGKTTVMSAFAELAKGKGYTVIGVAETNVAVGEIKSQHTSVQEIQQAGISQAMTVTKFLHDHKTHQDLNDKTIVIVDESSFTGAKSFKAIQDIISKSGARASFWGDKEQLPPIAAGFPFKELIDRSVIEHRELTDVIGKNIDSAFKKLNVIEDKQGDLYARAAQTYKERDGYKNLIISTYTNADKEKLNAMIRSDLQAEGKVSREEQVLQTWENRNLSGTDRFNSHQYDIGDKLSVMKAGAGVKVGAEFKIVGIDHDKKRLTVEGVSRTGGVYTKNIDIRRHGDKFGVYRQAEKEYAIGDKIIFNHTDKGTGIANSEVAYLKSINKDGSVTVDRGGKEVTTRSQHFEHGYASTTHKSQGKTSQGTMYFAPVQLRTGRDGNTFERGEAARYQDFYVGITRGKTEGIIITNDQTILKEQARRLAEKDTTYNHEGLWEREKRWGGQAARLGRGTGTTVRYSKNGLAEITRWEGRGDGRRSKTDSRTIHVPSAIARARIQREAIKGIDKPVEIGGVLGILGKVVHYEEKLIDKLPGFKHALRAGSDKFRSGAAREHLDKAIKQLERFEKNLKPEDYEKAMKEMRKADKEIGKMNPQERQKYEAAKSEAMRHFERTGKNQQIRTDHGKTGISDHTKISRSDGSKDSKTDDHGKHRTGLEHSRTDSRNNEKSESDNSKSHDFRESKADHSRDVELSK